MPVAYPRTGEVLEAKQVRLAAMTNFALGYPSARVSPPKTSGPPEFSAGLYSDLSASPFGARDEYFWVGQPVFSPELGVWIAPWGTCEGGVMAGFPRAGLELRCGLLQGRLGAPVSLAISGAAAEHFVYAPPGPELRTGLDVSIRTGSIEPLVDVYLGYGPHQWVITDWGIPDVVVRRNEWTLSVPLGVALNMDTSPRAFTFGLVPQFTLHATRPQTKATDVLVEYFHEFWALYFTFGGHMVL